jgi:hypothetical protein
LQEFEKKQKSIKSVHGKKKKKKGKKKKRGHETGGDAIDFDNESEGYSQIQKGEIAGGDEDVDNLSLENADGDR